MNSRHLLALCVKSIEGVFDVKSILLTAHLDKALSSKEFQTGLFG